MKKFLKKNLILKEEDTTSRPAVAASTDGTNDTPQKIVNDTKTKNPNAGSIVIPGKEMDGNTSTQTSTMEVNNDPTSLHNAQRLAQQANRMGQDIQFKVNVGESKRNREPITEGVQFTKKELNEWLKSL